MTFKELVYSNEDVNDRLDFCQSKDCCRKKVFQPKSSHDRESEFSNIQNLQKDVVCVNKIKRGPFVIKKDFSFSPAVLTIKKNNRYHSTVGPAIQQSNSILSYYLFGLKVSKTVHRYYRSDIFKYDFFNIGRLFFILLLYNSGILLWKDNKLYAMFYHLMLIFWATGVYFIYLIVNFEYDIIFIVACLLFTWQSFKIINGTKRSFENV